LCVYLRDAAVVQHQLQKLIMTFYPPKSKQDIWIV